MAGPRNATGLRIPTPYLRCRGIEGLAVAGRNLLALKGEEVVPVMSVSEVSRASFPQDLPEAPKSKGGRNALRVLRLQRQVLESERVTQALKERLGLRQLIGESPTFLAEIKKIPTMARCDVSVLILGETGTGKEVCARAIHDLSPRAHAPFVPVNCGAIPTELVENELFGHERGAFTDASTSQCGLIHEAEGGTLFLDEVDSLPALAQVKLLRFLQEKEYRRLGSTKTHRADVRIIAATNSDLEEAIQTGKLRRDLYYRLNVLLLTLPPLRERREDIPLLAHHFLARYAAEFKKQVMDFSADVMPALMFYHWPGNVRELEHIVERAVALSEQAVIGRTDIVLPHGETPTPRDSFQEAKAKVIAQFERTYITDLLLAHQGNITHAARAAQKNRRVFWQLMHKYDINPSSLKPKTL